MSADTGEKLPTQKVFGKGEDDDGSVASETKDKTDAQSDAEKKQQEADNKLASQIADIIASALDKIKPITNMIQQVRSLKG